MEDIENPKKSKLTLLWKEREKEQESFIDAHIKEKIDLYEQNDDDDDEIDKETHEAPAKLAVSLMKYQKEWLAWALKHEDSDVKGGILADEKGMGKTLQTIALVLAKQEIDCPTNTNYWPGLESSESSSSTTDLPKIKTTLVVYIYSSHKQRDNSFRPCSFGLY